MEFKVTDDVSLIGMQLKDIPNKVSSSILIGAVLRDDEVIIPNGEFEIRVNDTLYVIGRPSSVYNFFKRIGKYIPQIKNVMIVGGGRVSYYLARYLYETEMKAKIIEIDRDRCLELSELLPNTLIICGDGSDDTILNSENLCDMDAFVSITGRDEENLMSALLAKESGVQKVIAKINRINYPNVIKNMGIDSFVSPKQITANHIIRYVRGLEKAMGNSVETLYKNNGGSGRSH